MFLKVGAALNSVSTQRYYKNSWLILGVTPVKLTGDVKLTKPQTKRQTNKQINMKHSGHLRSLEKCRKHSLCVSVEGGGEMGSEGGVYTCSCLRCLTSCLFR